MFATPKKFKFVKNDLKKSFFNFFEGFLSPYNNNADRSKDGRQPFKEVFHFSWAAPRLPAFVPLKSVRGWIVIVNNHRA